MIDETRYVNVEKEMSAILALQDSEGFSMLVSRLEMLLSDGYGALKTELNPVITNLPNWNIDDLKFLAKEYSGFSNEAIHMFHDASIRLQWPEVKDEIDRNVSEEMGVLTNGIPHLELMRHGYRDELGVETDNVEYSSCTHGFIKRMREIFRSGNNAFICGALLAFEGTATFEFKGVEKILRTLKGLQGGEIDPTSFTGQYILGHVDDVAEGENPEDDHYNGMREAVGKCINADNSPDFVRGYVAVCTALNAWWEQLAIEVYVDKLNRYVNPHQRKIDRRESMR